MGRLNAPGWGTSGIKTATAVCALLGLLATVGILPGFDNACYDRLLSICVHRLFEARPTVLLVEVPPDTSLNETEATRLIQRLRDLKAKQIVFSSFPVGASAEFYERAAGFGNILFGRAVIPDPRNFERKILEPLPVPEGIDWGVVSLPMASGGVHRHANRTVSVNGTVYASLAAVAADPSLESASPGRSAEEFRVRFLGAAGTFPRLSLGSAIDRGLVEQLVSGRTVLIGEGSRPTNPGLRTPVNSDRDPLPFLEFQGNAMHTLIQDQPIQAMGPASTTVLVGLSVLGLMLLHQRMSMRMSLLLTLALVAGTAVLALALLATVGFWLPAGHLMAAEAFLYVAVGRARMVQTDTALNRVRITTMRKLKERAVPDNDPTGEQYWENMAALISQMIDFNRLVFFELRPLTFHLVLRKTVHCTEDEIAEMRRDVRRGPFSDSIQTQKLVPVQKFLKPLPNDEQYVSALIFAGEVAGVWVMSISPENRGAMEDFEGTINAFGREVAAAVVGIGRAAVPQTMLGRVLRFISRERHEDVYRSLNQTVEQLMHRLTSVEGILRESDTATIIYDLFGRILSVNVRMQEYLQSVGLNAADLTALDLVSRLTTQDAVETRRQLRYLVMTGNQIRLPVRVSESRERKFFLIVRPLRRDQAEANPGALFHVSGFACELQDVTLYARLNELRAMLNEQLGVQVRNDLASIEICASMLESIELEETERNETFRSIEQRVQSALRVLADSEHYLAQVATDEVQETYPVDVLLVFAKALKDHQQLFQSRKLAVHVSEPRLMNHGLASQEGLNALFQAVFNLLAADTVDEGEINVRIWEDSDWVSLEFANTGFGIPNDRFQSYLGRSDLESGRDMLELRAALKSVSSWNGQSHAESAVGVGFRFLIQLKRFI
jgi:CHASE2 domain-containing sensor protein